MQTNNSTTYDTAEEKRQMTFKEVTMFFEDLCWSEMPSALTADMLIYFLSTLEKKISEKPSDAQDFINDLTRYVHNEMTSHGQNSTHKYIDGIANRLKTFGYSQNNNENWDRAKKEVYGKEEKVESILDLSNQRTKEDECLNLAEHFVAIIENPLTPEKIKIGVENALIENSESLDSYKDLGYIASILCRNLDGNNT